MVPEVNCQECQENLHELSMEAGNALELGALLSPALQAHLQDCSDCRQVCAGFLGMEPQLRQLRQDLPAPDLRRAVMERLRKGERAAYPEALEVALRVPREEREIATRQLAGARLVVLFIVSLTVLAAWQAPLWMPAANTVGDLFSIFQGWGDWCAWPDFALVTPGWDAPLLLVTLTLCAVQTRAWLQVQRG